eukprot:352103-Chlamydomonas_euryale.AAC.9
MQSPRSKLPCSKLQPSGQPGAAAASRGATKPHIPTAAKLHIPTAARPHIPTAAVSASSVAFDGCECAHARMGTQVRMHARLRDACAHAVL